MQVDPEVNRLKFETEMRRLAEQRAILEARGVLILGSTTYPFIDLLIVSRHPLRVLAPTTQSGMIVLPQPAIITVEVPSLAASAFKARFDLTDYDLRAPSLSFLDPWTDVPLRYVTMFRALEFEEQRQAHVVLLDDHPATHRPFLCLRGIREYHEHPQHSGDEWLLYRRDMSLFSIVMSLWRVSVDLIHPQLVLQSNGIQVQWTAQEKI